MATRIQVVFDCADPDRLARFWASALGYHIPPPPGDFDSWEAWLQAQGIPEDQWNSASAVEDPDGEGDRAKAGGRRDRLPSPHDARVGVTRSEGEGDVSSR